MAYFSDHPVHAVRCMITRWRAYMILKPYPPAERAALRIKICAAGVLYGKRQQWGYRRKWEGNYLFLVCFADNNHNHNNNTKYSQLSNTHLFVPVAIETGECKISAGSGHLSIFQHIHQS